MKFDIFSGTTIKWYSHPPGYSPILVVQTEINSSFVGVVTIIICNIPVSCDEYIVGTL